MSAVPKAPFLSPAEYLARERQSATRSEYLRGEVFAMSGATREHNVINGNLFGEIRAQLKGRSCEAYSSDMRVKVAATGLYTYPDLTVVCGTREFDDSFVDCLLNPIVLGEVLSSSTEAYDRGDKAAHYRRIASLREYLLVSQNRVRVEHFVRQDDKWVLSELDSVDDVLHLPSIDCHISLRDIYDRIEFSTEGAESVAP